MEFAEGERRGLSSTPHSLKASLVHPAHTTLWSKGMCMSYSWHFLPVCFWFFRHQFLAIVNVAVSTEQHNLQASGREVFHYANMSSAGSDSPTFYHVEHQQKSTIGGLHSPNVEVAKHCRVLICPTYRNINRIGTGSSYIFLFSNAEALDSESLCRAFRILVTQNNNLTVPIESNRV